MVASGCRLTQATSLVSGSGNANPSSLLRLQTPCDASSLPSSQSPGPGCAAATHSRDHAPQEDTCPRTRTPAWQGQLKLGPLEASLTSSLCCFPSPAMGKPRSLRQGTAGETVLGRQASPLKTPGYFPWAAGGALYNFTLHLHDPLLFQTRPEEVSLCGWKQSALSPLQRSREEISWRGQSRRRLPRTPWAPLHSRWVEARGRREACLRARERSVGSEHAKTET